METIIVSRSGWKGYKCEHLAEQKGESILTISDGDLLINLLINRFKEILTGTGNLFINNLLYIIPHNTYQINEWMDMK